MEIFTTQSLADEKCKTDNPPILTRAALPSINDLRVQGMFFMEAKRARERCEKAQ